MWNSIVSVPDHCLFIYSTGHVTKMAAMPIYGKIHLKIFSETRRLMTFKLGIQHQGLRPTKFVQMIDLDLLHSKVSFAP